MVYRSTDCRRRCGAAVEYLAHSASFHSWENNAPSKPGIKHLGPPAPPDWRKAAAVHSRCRRCTTRSWAHGWSAGPILAWPPHIKLLAWQKTGRLAYGIWDI